MESAIVPQKATADVSPAPKTDRKPPCAFGAFWSIGPMPPPRTQAHTSSATPTASRKGEPQVSIKFLETWGSPFLLAVGVALLVWAWVRGGGIGPMLQNAPNAHGGFRSVFGAGLTSAVAFWGTMALSIPDFSRYARSQRDQVIGQAVGLPATMALFAFIGAAVTNATLVIFGTRIADPVAL